MKIAVFVETYTPTMGADHRQVMMIPHNDTVRVFSRLSDGNKGYGNRWDESDIETVVNAMDASETITCIPSGVRLTAKDIEALDLKGYAPVLMTKAVNAHLKSLPFDEETDAAERICALYQDVSVQSSSLEDLIIDLRSQAPASPFLPQSASTQTSTANNLDELPRVALASIPPMDRAKAYISRDIVGIQDLEVYDKARANKFDVLIYGPTGPGKTSSVVAWAASRKLRMATVSGNAALEPSQLIGKYIPDGKGGFVWIDGPVTDVVRNGGVLCLDEVNFISPKIYTVLYSLLDDRRCLILLDHMGETVEAHPDLTIFATMNPNYIGTTPLNFAFRNRYVVQIPWDYDDKVEDKLVKSQALKILKNQLRAEANKGEFETPISTNMLMEFEKLVKVFSFEFAVENFIAHFELEEQDKVRLVFTTHEYNLKSDFDLVETLDQDKGDDSTGLGENIVTEVENWLTSNNTPTNP